MITLRNTQYHTANQEVNGMDVNPNTENENLLRDVKRSISLPKSSIITTNNSNNIN